MDEGRDVEVGVGDVEEAFVEAGIGLAEIAGGGAGVRVAVAQDGGVDVAGVPDVLLVDGRRDGGFARGPALAALADLQALPGGVVVVLADRPVAAGFGLVGELADAAIQAVVAVLGEDGVVGAGAGGFDAPLL